MWAPLGERPIADGHHRFDWLYVTAFVSPATGETFWYVSNGVSKEFFAALLETFARTYVHLVIFLIATVFPRQMYDYRSI